MKSRRAFVPVLAAMLFCCWIGYAESDVSAAGQKIGLRVLYAGHPDSERERDFVEFLEKHFVKVRKGDLAKFVEEQAKDYDVVIMDYDGAGFESPRPQIDRGYTRSTVTVGVTGAFICGNLGLKTDYT